MKKTLFAGFLLATLSTVNMNAKTFAVEEPEEAKTFRYSTCYVTETVGKCKITYKITTKYILCFPICTTRCEVKRDCSGHGPGER